MKTKITKSDINFYKKNGYLILRNCINKKNFHNFNNNVFEIINRELDNKT